MNEPISLSDSTPILSEYAGDPDYEDLIELFVMGVPDKIAEFTTAYDSRDWPTLQVLSHQLKGAGGGYGFAGLSIAAADLETACKADDPAQVGEAYHRLIHDLNRVSG